MKKTIFLAAVAAIIAITSCQKEAPVQEINTDDPVFTARIATDASKTTIDAATGKVAWEATDTIIITDNAGTSAKYAVSEIDAEGKATFVKTSEETNTLGEGPYTATYGIAPELEQIYSETAPALPMSAESETRSLTFTVTCCLLELSLTAGESVTSIEVTGTPTGGSETTYTLTCSTPVSIASGANFFIALPAGSYTSFLINGQNGAQCKKSGSGVAIQANHITPVSFSKALHFAVQLWKDGPYWATTNIGAEKPEDYGQYFAWGYPTGQTPSVTSFSTAFNSTNYQNVTMATLDATHDMATVNWGTGWSVPTMTDLVNLISSSNTSIECITTGTAGIRVTGTTSGYTSNSIFLPAAGSGVGSNLDYAGDFCGYWSNVQGNGDAAGGLGFLPGNGNSSVSYNYKYFGFSVRPVRSSL